jgi:hypothetical protein
LIGRATHDCGVDLRDDLFYLLDEAFEKKLELYVVV